MTVFVEFSTADRQDWLVGKAVLILFVVNIANNNREGIILKLVVCLKQTLDPELPTKEFRIDREKLEPIRGNAKLVADSYGENALETAIQLKEKNSGSMTAISIGDKSADEVLRRALALNADSAIRVWDAGWDKLDAPAAAHLLAKVIANLGGADLILCGRQSADLERGAVGPMLAEELGYACATLVSSVEVNGNKIRATCEVENGAEVVEISLPAVITVTSSETNNIRLPKVKDTMMAARKPIQAIGPADIQPEAVKLEPRLRLQDLSIPELGGQCEIMEGQDVAEKASALVQSLRQRKVL